jgi:hypothetical protein
MYAYLNSGPIGSVDPTGLFDAAAHYYGTYIAAICAGRGVDEAMSLAYYAQYPDQVHRFDALSLGEQWGFRQALTHSFPELGDFPPFRNWARAEDEWMYKVMETLHTLKGGDPKKAQDCLGAMLRVLQMLGYPAQVIGTVIHAYGDAHTHYFVDDAGNKVLYRAPLGHAIDSASGRRRCPDNACHKPDRVIAYMENLCMTLGGDPRVCRDCVGRVKLPIESLVNSDRGIFRFRGMDDPDEYTPWFRGLAVKQFGFPEDGWAPGKYNTDAKRRPISPSEMSGIMDLIQCACR